MLCLHQNQHIMVSTVDFEKLYVQDNDHKNAFGRSE
jgi:hypothetical protein